jgi:hypothetical protein
MSKRKTLEIYPSLLPPFTAEKGQYECLRKDSENKLYLEDSVSSRGA